MMLMRHYIGQTINASGNANNISLVRVDNNYFVKSFFPSTISEWNKLDLIMKTIHLGNHPFNTNAKSSEKLTFPDKHKHVWAYFFRKIWLTY